MAALFSVRRSVGLTPALADRISTLAASECQTFEVVLRMLIVEALRARDFAAAQAAARGPACGDASAAGEAAINFGGYGGAYPSSVPVGNTGTTSTGQGV